MGSVIEICMLQAQALRMGGQVRAARRTLARALALAEPEGYIRLFVDEGEPMRFLIEDFGFWSARQPPDAQQERLSAYIAQLLGAFGPVAEAERSPSSLEHPPIQNLQSRPEGPRQNPVEPLTGRELEVLRLIAAGLANATIAEQLVITVGTVKTHLKHIFGKLGVESRTQAVAQARQLGLF
jgi:LuxR family maltose regulon positive regulatory protein